jgi:hypothetical protein
LRLKIERRSGAAFAVGTAPARRVVRLRIQRCAGRRSRRTSVRAQRSGRFSRRLGRLRRLRGCRVTATLKRGGRAHASMAVRVH